MAFCNFAKIEINELLSNFKFQLLYKVESLMTLFRWKDKDDRIYVLHSYITSYKCTVCDFNISNLSMKWIEWIMNNSSIDHISEGWMIVAIFRLY